KSLRDERPAAAAVRGQFHADAGRLQHFGRGHSNVGMTVIRKRVVEEDDARLWIAPACEPAGEGPARPPRERAAAIYLKQFVAEPSSRGTAYDGIGQWCEPAAPFRQDVDAADGARAPRDAVPL